MLPARRLATRGVVPADLTDLPAGSVVLVLASTGYGKSRLAREWLEASGPGAVLVDLADRAGEPLEMVLDAVGSTGTRGEGDDQLVVIVDSVEHIASNSANTFVHALQAGLPTGATLALLGRRVPDNPDVPTDARLVHVSQSQLAVERGDIELGTKDVMPGSRWPLEVEDILIEDCLGWPAAVPFVTRQLARQRDVGLDPSLLRHVLTLEAGAAIEADLRTMDPERLRMLTEIALVAPATTDQLRRCFGERALADLQTFMTAPVQMLRCRKGVWDLAPVFRDILLARDPQQWERRMPLNLELADDDARSGQLEQGLARIKRLNSRSGLARFIGEWALHESVRGFPVLGARLMREFDRDEVRRVPELMLVQAVINVLTPDLPSTIYWLDLLEVHHDSRAPRWSCTDAATTNLLREIVGSRPVGPVSRAALNSAPAWAAGLAHVMVATERIGRGDHERAEGILSGAKAYSREFPLIGGWRVALLTHVLIETGRVDRAIEHYRRVEPMLAASDFRGQRITFLIDSAMGRCAALAGDAAKAEELMSRSLDKTPEFRAGAWSTRMLAYYNNAFTADSLGKTVVAQSAIDAALGLKSKASDAPALVALVEGLRRQVGGQRRGPALTPMQLRVLAHLDSHYSVPDIADQLVLSPATIRSHVRQVYAALGVTSRADAVQRARALGILD